MADLASSFQPICGSQRTFNHQLPRREDVRIGSTKSPVTRNLRKTEMSFEETCLFAASGNAAQTASLMKSRIPMPRAIFEGPRQGPGSPRKEKRRNLKPCLEQRRHFTVCGSHRRPNRQGRKPC
jgi:hypothetical protein